MSKKFEWAKDYVKRYEDYIKQRGTMGSTLAGGIENELYKLAKAIVDDVYGDMP